MQSIWKHRQATRVMPATLDNVRNNVKPCLCLDGRLLQILLESAFESRPFRSSKIQHHYQLTQCQTNSIHKRITRLQCLKKHFVLCKNVTDVSTKVMLQQLQVLAVGKMYCWWIITINTFVLWVSTKNYVHSGHDQQWYIIVVCGPNVTMVFKLILLTQVTTMVKLKQCKLDARWEQWLSKGSQSMVLWPFCLKITSYNS